MISKIKVLYAGFQFSGVHFAPLSVLICLVLLLALSWYLMFRLPTKRIEDINKLDWQKTNAQNEIADYAAREVPAGLHGLSRVWCRQCIYCRHSSVHKHNTTTHRLPRQRQQWWSLLSL